MTVIVTDTDGAWRMADVIWVDVGAKNPKVPTLFQVADVDTGVINWVNADLVTRICPRAWDLSPLQAETACRGSGRREPRRSWRRRRSGLDWRWT